jgi:Protein phosphatase 2C
VSARLPGVWRVAGASVPGAGHLRSGLPCQDDHCWQVETDGVLIAAVADGAGSASHAEEGARAAVRAAVDQAATIWRTLAPREREEWDHLLQGAFIVARLAVQSAAKTLGRPIHDLATTLLLAVATPDQTAAAQIGDGAVVARLAGEGLTALTRPPVTEHLNETTFLTSDDALSEMQFALCDEPARGLAMLSDGLQMLALKMPQGEPHAPFFAPLLRFTAAAAEPERAEEQLRKFLQSPGVAQRTDDDLTLLLAVRRPAR